MKLITINKLLSQKFSKKILKGKMSHNKGNYNKLKAMLLLTTFLFTFALNALHFVIFTHDHNHENESIGIADSYFDNVESHSLCQWEFGNSIPNHQVSCLNSHDYTYIAFPLKKYFRNYTKALRNFSLRAPPY